MSTSPESICSAALHLLGVESIDSLEDEDDVAATCNALYQTAKDAAISEYPWRFAIQKSQLTRLTDTPENEWKYAFQLPSDIEGGPHAVFNSGDEGAVPIKNWELFGNKIFSNEESLWIDHRVSVVEAKFPPYFVQFMVFEMASLLAVPITEDEAKADFWRKVARGTPQEGGKGGYYQTATQADAMGNTGSQIDDYELIRARMGDR